jgi:glutamate dehydrogenase/leucine dehydrogenase
VIEATKNPTGAERQKPLGWQRSELMPEILCEAGGDIVNYFKQLQNKRAEVRRV